MSTIHPTAVVHPGAFIGDAVTIGPFVIVDDHARIGDRTRLESHNRIGAGAIIGQDCTVMHGAVIAAAPGADTPAAPPPCHVRIGDRTIVREFVTIERGSSADEETVIGTRCLLMGCCHVESGCTIGDTVILANDTRLGRGVRIEDFAIVGGNCGIDPSTRLGAHCMIAGTSEVVKDVPPFVLAGRTPLAFEGLNLVGLRRRNFTPEVIRALDAAYTILYMNDADTALALDRVRSDIRGCSEVDHVVSFVASTRNGIISKHHR